MNPRVILEKLLARLEPIVGRQRSPDIVTEEGELTAGRSGRLHFVEAVLEARAALASGDETRILNAAITCPTFERTGRELQAEHRVQERRRKGGQLSGAQQAGRRAAVWAPWERDFQKLLASGKTQAEARRIIVMRMTKQGFVDPATGDVPAERTIRNRLKAKIVGK
jgi:hypothetical protein